MNDDRDPMLQALFAETQRELAPGDFIQQLTRRIEKQQRRSLMIKCVFAVIIAIAALALAAPIEQLVAILAVPLLDLNNPTAAAYASPINNFAAGIAMFGLLIHLVRKRARW